MMDVQMPIMMNGVTVHTTSSRGFTPEELADQALEKILHVGENVHPVIRDQAKAFKEQIRVILVHYMGQAIRSDRTTLISRLKMAGHHDLVKLLEK
jgi:hypothetical protein